MVTLCVDPAECGGCSGPLADDAPCNLGECKPGTIIEPFEPDNQCVITDNSSIVDTCLNYLILDLTLFSQRKNIDVQKNISKMMSVKTSQLNNLF